MFIYLSLIVTLLALCGLVVSLATPASNRIANMVRLDLGKTLIYCLALTIVIALCTIPYIPPFSQGMHLGWGFLIGGIAGILAIFEAAGNINGIGWVRRAVAMISIAVLSTAPIIFIFRGDPTDILIGIAIAAVLVSIIGIISFRLAGKDNTTNIAGVNWLTLFILAISIAAIGSRLAIIFPFKEISTLSHAPYWLLPQIVLSVIMLVFSLLVRTDFNNFKLKQFLIVSISSVVLISLTLFVITKYLLPEVNFAPALIGGITFILIGLMLYIYKDAENIPMSLLIIAGFFIISISTISLRYMGGLGQMIAAATALSVIALPALANKNNRMLTEISFTLVSLLLFMGLERYLYYQAHGKMLLDFQIQYNQIAIIIGMGVVWISTKIINRLFVDVNIKPWKIWVQVAILSLIMIILPPITYSLWSVGGLWACLTGMLLGAIGWLFLTQMNTGEARDKFINFSPLLLIILIVMSSIQIIPILMDERFIITRSSAHVGAMILFIPVVIVFMVEILRNKEQDNA